MDGAKEICAIYAVTNESSDILQKKSHLHMDENSDLAPPQQQQQNLLIWDI